MRKYKYITFSDRKRMPQIDLARKTGIYLTIINAIYHAMMERINLAYRSKICAVLVCEVEDILQFILNEEDY